MLQSSKIKIINIPTNWVPKNPVFGIRLGAIWRPSTTWKITKLNTELPLYVYYNIVEIQPKGPYTKIKQNSTRKLVKNKAR